MNIVSENLIIEKLLTCGQEFFFSREHESVAGQESMVGRTKKKRMTETITARVN